jgi:hypothetical protein
MQHARRPQSMQAPNVRNMAGPIILSYQQELIIALCQAALWSSALLFRP